MARRIHLAAAGLTLTVLFSFLLIHHARSQAVSDQFLSGVEVAEIGDCAIVRIGLNFPARITSHFPPDHGSELTLRVRSLVVSREVLTERVRQEALRPPKSKRAAIRQILYEVDPISGPTLTLYFRHDVAYQVDEGANFRSLIIAVAGKNPSPSCRPEFPNHN